MNDERVRSKAWEELEHHLLQNGFVQNDQIVKLVRQKTKEFQVEIPKREIHRWLRQLTQMNALVRVQMPGTSVATYSLPLRHRAREEKRYVASETTSDVSSIATAMTQPLCHPAPEEKRYVTSETLSDVSSIATAVTQQQLADIKDGDASSVIDDLPVGSSAWNWNEDCEPELSMASSTSSVIPTLSLANLGYTWSEDVFLYKARNDPTLFVLTSIVEAERLHDVIKEIATTRWAWVMKFRSQKHSVEGELQALVQAHVVNGRTGFRSLSQDNYNRLVQLLVQFVKQKT